MINVALNPLLRDKDKGHKKMVLYLRGGASILLQRPSLAIGGCFWPSTLVEVQFAVDHMVHIDRQSEYVSQWAYVCECEWV